MVNIVIRSLSALTVVVATIGLAAPAQATEVSISGGAGVDSIPQGTSGNSVLEQAGIGFAGGQIWVDGTLDNLSNGVMLTLYDVGSESEWRSQIRLGNSSGKKLQDNDNHTQGGSGVFTNGPAPFQLVGSVTQYSGVANFEFWRVYPDPDTQIVVNGQSPMTVISGYEPTSIALAYLSDTNQIVSDPTNRILVLLEDGGTDRDYDDYVGILVAATPPPQPIFASISGGTQVSSIPQGNSGNQVLAQAGIGIADGQIWVDGTLDNLNDVTLTLYDVGSESHWKNQIWLGKKSGKWLKDNDDHWRGTTEVFVHSPFQLVGSVTQISGLTNFQFWRILPDPDYQIVVNGQSPMMMVPGYGFASIALAYLSDTNQIVSTPTNRILVLLEDGGTDRDYDDYVGILVASP